MTKLTKQGRADLGLSAVTLAISIVVFWNASKLPPAPFDPLGPKSFPMGIAVALGLVSLIALVRTILGQSIGRSDVSIIQGIGDEPPEDYKLRPGLAIICTVLTIVYVAVMSLTEISFMWSTMAYMAALGWAMSDRTKKHAVIAILIAVIGAFCVNYLFTKIFIVDLP